MAYGGKRGSRGGRGSAHGGARGSRSRAGARGGRSRRDRDDDYYDRPMPARGGGMGPAEISLLVGGGIAILICIVYFVIAGVDPEAGSPIDHKGIRQEHKAGVQSVAAGELLEEAKAFENLEEFEYGEQIIRYQKVISRFPGTPQAKEAQDRIAHVRMKERREW